MVRLFQLVDTWLDRIDPFADFTWPAETLIAGVGFGATEAARGALAHWMEIENGLVKRYRLMPPTVWNVGPTDETPKKGPIEAALIGLKVENPANPVEVGHTVRSFDTCLVSTVKVLDERTDQEITRFKFLIRICTKYLWYAPFLKPWKNNFHPTNSVRRKYRTESGAVG